MKKVFQWALVLLAVQSTSPFQQNSKDVFRESVNQHPYSTREKLSPEQIKGMTKQDRPDLAWEQDFLATMNPALGRPTPENLFPIYQQVAQSQNNSFATPGSVSSPWVERGPTNVGGRTRALAYDPNDVTGKKVWAGGATGGLWYNSDITSASSQWTAVNDFWDNIAITCIAFDPNTSSTIYVGTGESWGGASRGAGIWKSTNSGTTWTQLPATSSFYYINDLIVRNESSNSVVYAAVAGRYYNGSWHGLSSGGLQRSTNGGSSFTQVLPNVPGQTFNYSPADIELAANNKLWVGTIKSSYSGSDKGGGRILSSTNGTTWSVSYTNSGGDRVELACAPNDANYVYGMIESGSVVDEMVRTTNGGSSWSAMNEPNDADNGIPASDFSRGQAWYDLILAVDPNNKNTVLAGGVDLFRSTNGGTAWSQISKWSNNNNLAALSCSRVHADQHAIIFKAGSSNQVLFGNDGGVFYTNSLTTAATNNVISARNNGYNVTQFYAVAMHPTAGSNYFLAGSQDNGTQRFNSAGLAATTSATGGDGAFCFIDQTNPNYQITSYVYNSYWRSTNGGTSFAYPRMQSDQTTGKFINPADYDDNLGVLYSARTTSTINRISSIRGTFVIDNFTVSGMNSMASHLRVSPYGTTNSTLFVGTSAGDVYKVTNAQSATPSSSSIGGSLPSGNISCIEIGASDSELIVTLSNYGTNSVWYTSNGGSSWASREGNLPNMPVRWALFNPSNRSEVLLATEVGVWSTTNFNASSPSWAPSNSGLANVRVDMLQIRDSDKQVVAATFGRGLFTSDGFNTPAGVQADFAISKQYPCLNEIIQLNDSSTGATSWSWSISPSSYSFNTGSSASSQNPEISFSSNGLYTITLVASNGSTSDSLTLSQAVQAGGASLPFTENFEGSVAEWFLDNPDNGTTWGLYAVAGNSPGNRAAGIDNYNYNGAGQRDGLISPVLNLTGYTSVTLDFDYAYRRYGSSNSDSLAVYVSSNCGNTWQQIALFGENGTGNFATGADLTSAFTPALSGDWCGSSPSCPSLSLNAYAGMNNVKVKFENINGYGNNLFLDNVNITGSTSSAPVANFSSSKTNACTIDPVTLSDQSSNTPTSWAWSFNPNTVTYVSSTSANSQNPMVNFNAAGNYTVTLVATNAIGNDSETKTNYISVAASVTPLVSITSNKTTICQGENINFTAVPTNGGTSPSYQWKINGTNAGTNSANFNSSAIQNGDQVTVVLNSNASCLINANATSNAISLTVNSYPAVAVNTPQKLTAYCKEDTLALTASPPGGTWSGSGVVGASFYPATAGTGQHWVTYTVANSGCLSADSLMVDVSIIPKPTISQSAAVLTCNETGYTYQWFDGGMPISGAKNQTYTPVANGSYSVQISSNNCWDNSTNVDINDFAIGEISKTFSVEVFPNPTNGNSTLSLKNVSANKVSYKIYSASGALIFEKELNAASQMEETLNISGLPAGIYTLQLLVGNEMINEKITKN